MSMSTDPLPFPMAALPPILGAAVRDVVEQTGAPLGLVVTAALGAASTACQAAIDVERPAGIGRGPVSLFLISIAESGERKTTVDAAFLPPLKNAEREQISRQQGLQREFEAELSAWKAEERGLESALQASARRGESTEGLRAQLQQHAEKRPSAPRHGRFFFSNTTPIALLENLATGVGSATLHSDEAAALVHGHAMEDLGTLCSLWGGQDQTVDRRDKAGSFRVQNARLTLNLMMQKAVFITFCQRRGGMARKGGLLARSLICKPTSTVGTRYIRGDYISAREGLTKFNDRVKQILELGLNNGANHSTRTVMTLEQGAAFRWIDFNNEAEHLSKPEEAWGQIQDAASKAADNTARLAAIFEYIETGSHTISQDSLARAVDTVKWYMAQFDRIFGKTMHLDDDNEKGQELLRWIKEWIERNPCNYLIPIGTIYRTGPAMTRKRVDCDEALNWLASRGLISIQYVHDFNRLGRPIGKPRKYIQLQGSLLDSARYVRQGPFLVPIETIYQPGARDIGHM